MTTHLITAAPTATPAEWQASPPEPAVLEAENVSIYYGSFRAIKDVTLHVPPRRITALIGPSGSGKSTLLRAFNRMNELIPGTALQGAIRFHGKNLYAPDVDPVVVRRQIGMVFQRPTPSPRASTITSLLARASTAGTGAGAIWMRWSSGRCARRRSGLK